MVLCNVLEPYPADVPRFTCKHDTAGPQQKLLNVVLMRNSGEETAAHACSRFSVARRASWLHLSRAWLHSNGCCANI